MTPRKQWDAEELRVPLLHSRAGWRMMMFSEEVTYGDARSAYADQGSGGSRRIHADRRTGGLQVGHVDVAGPGGHDRPVLQHRQHHVQYPGQSILAHVHEHELVAPE